MNALTSASGSNRIEEGLTTEDVARRAGDLLRGGYH